MCFKPRTPGNNVFERPCSYLYNEFAVLVDLLVHVSLSVSVINNRNVTFGCTARTVDRCINGIDRMQNRRKDHVASNGPASDPMISAVIEEDDCPS